MYVPLSLLLAGCGHERFEPSPTSDESTDTGTPVVTPPAPTTPTTAPPPSRVEVTCQPTDNVLRFGCHVVVEPAQPVEVRFVRADGTGASRIHPGPGFTTDHDVPLYILAPDTPYDVVATSALWPDARRARTTVTTGHPPPEVDTWLTVEGTSTMGLVGTELPCNTDAVAVIYDTTTGELVWYQEIDPDGQLGLMDMIRFTDDHTVLGEAQTSIVEVDLAGNELLRLDRGIAYDEWFHHDIYKWSGNYYLLYQSIGLGVILDSLVVLDPAGNVVARWIAAQHLQIPDDAYGDWMHTNTVYVDDSGDIYLSLRTQSTVLKLVGDIAHPDFGDVIWILAGGEPAGLGSTIDIDWTGIPEPAEFQEQHNVHVRRDGRLMLLDNDNGRALILTMEPLTDTATVDAAYPTVELQCGPQGTAMETLAGNPVVGCYLGPLREYDLVTGAPIWESEVGCAQVGGLFGTGGARWYPLDGW